MKFNEFLAHAKKANGMPLDTLAKEVGSHMVLYPENCMRVIERALAHVESPEGIRWDFISECLNDGVTLELAIVVAVNPGCLKLLGDHSEIKDDSDKGFALAVLNGLDMDSKFNEYFDFEKYWNRNGGDTLTTSYGVYLWDTRELASVLKGLSNC